MTTIFASTSAEWRAWLNCSTHKWAIGGDLLQGPWLTPGLEIADG
jgi:hypothetical protein